jgi:hypothetical protein
MKKLSLFIVVLGLFGMSEVFAKDAESIEDMTGRADETCSIMPSDIGETAVREIVAGEVVLPEAKKRLEVPVEK